MSTFSLASFRQANRLLGATLVLASTTLLGATSADASGFSPASTGRSAAELIPSQVIISSPNTFLFGEGSHFEANVVPEVEGGSLEGGQVQFSLDGSPTGAAQTVDSSGAVSVDFDLPLAPGIHLLTADFTGTDTVAGSSIAQNFWITLDNVNLAVTISPDTPFMTYGDPLTITVHVTPEQGTSPINDGTVELRTYGVGAVYGPVEVVDGLATFYLTNPPAGQLSLQADYSSDLHASNSKTVRGPFIEGIQPTIVVTAEPASVKFGAPITFTVIAIGVEGDPVPPRGSVSLSYSPYSAQPVELPLINGTASFSASALRAGDNSVTVYYSRAEDESRYYETRGGGAYRVEKAPTTTTLTSNTNASDIGSQVTFTASVTSEAESVTPLAFSGPTQFVEFTIDDDATHMVEMVDGAAVLITSELTAGSHQVSARYVGTIDFEGSQSLGLTHVVDSSSTPESQSITPGPTSPTAAMNSTEVRYSPSLANTGFDFAFLIAISGLLYTFGLVALAVSRRRRKGTAR